MEVLIIFLLFVLSFFIQCRVFEKMGLKEIEYKCGFNVEEAFEGDEIQFIERVHNNKRLPVPWLKVDIHTSRWLDFAGKRSSVAEDSRRVTSSYFFRSYQKVTRQWHVKCVKRGIFHTKNVSLVSGDLFGISAISTSVCVDARLVVYPGTVNLEELFTPINYLQGNVIVKRWIIDDPFIVSGTREYAPGDAINRIHWPATAHQGRLMVRNNDFTSLVSLTIMLNIQSRDCEFGDVFDKEKMEFGIKVAATLIDRAVGMGIPVSLATNACGQEDKSPVFTKQESGRNHGLELMKILAGLRLRNVRNFDEFLARNTERLENTEAVIVTAYINDSIINSIRNIIKEGNKVKVLLLDTEYISDSRLPGDIQIYMLK